MNSKPLRDLFYGDFVSDRNKSNSVILKETIDEVVSEHINNTVMSNCKKVIDLVNQAKWDDRRF